MTKILAKNLGTLLINRMRNDESNLRIERYKLITPNGRFDDILVDQHMDEPCYDEFASVASGMMAGVLKVNLESEYFSLEKHFAIIRQGDYFLMEQVFEEGL